MSDERRAGATPAREREHSPVESSPGGDEARRENRLHGRAPIQLKVEYRRTNSFLSDYTRNISRGGTFIVTDRPLAVGTLFRFTFTVAPLPNTFELSGEVIWARSEGPERGMGIRFVYASDEERRQMEEAMERILVDSLGPELAGRLLASDPTRR